MDVFYFSFSDSNLMLSHIQCSDNTEGTPFWFIHFSKNAILDLIAFKNNTWFPYAFLDQEWVTSALIKNNLWFIDAFLIRSNFWLVNILEQWTSLTLGHPWSLVILDLWSSLIFDPPWSLIGLDLWSALIFDPPWYLILLDLWSSLIFDPPWSLVLLDYFMIHTWSLNILDVFSF